MAHPARPNPHRGWSTVGQEKLSGITGFQKGVMNPVQREDTKVPSCTLPYLLEGSQSHLSPMLTIGLGNL